MYVSLYTKKIDGYFLTFSAGAMDASKRGNFFHIESIQPMPESDGTG